MIEFSKPNTSIKIFNGDFLQCYKSWDGPPTVIISDGPYGINGYPGDLLSPENLANWYEPFIKAWSEVSTPQTTLWFWNTELGWANVHNMIVANGWDFVNCHIWDKGLGHVAGNVNTKTIRQFPIVTEVCVQYVKRSTFNVDEKVLSMQDWLRFEWERTGLPFSKTNEACGMKNAATRKYFTKCHLWYMPPSDAFEKIVEYANTFGSERGRPYFSIDGKKSLAKGDWEAMRSKFYCKHGITNVWRLPPLNGEERIKDSGKAIHLNQKPLKLMRLAIEASSDENDIVWEPFGGLCTSAVASFNLNRNCYSAEIDPEVFLAAKKRLEGATSQLELGPLLVA